jgi:hypothetical protein
MKIVLDANSRIDQLKAEIGAHGWVGMAWACLRRNPAYRSAVDGHGRTRARDLCAEFGIRKVKHPSQSFQHGCEPEFKPVRVVGRCNRKTVNSTSRVRQKTIRLNPTQVAIVISLDQDIRLQWLLSEAVLKRAKARLGVRGKGMRNLRPFSVMVGLVARALMAFELSMQGWGPSRIGGLLFTEKKRSAAKTSARDLVQRGRRYVKRDYLRFAMQASIDAAPKTPRKVQAGKCSGSMQPNRKIHGAIPVATRPSPAVVSAESVFEIITPLPPYHKRG